MSPGQRSSVRIISGTKRGSKIQFYNERGLRPSGDRIRETLFAWLQTKISGSECLDMFAGSGALAFEAASRGAARVIALEKNRQAANVLAENNERLKFANVKIFAADALSDGFYRKQLAAQQFDLLFIDPPFADNLHQSAIDLVHRQQLLRDGAFVYLEMSKGGKPLSVPDQWQVYREKVAGEVQVVLYRLIAAG